MPILPSVQLREQAPRRQLPAVGPPAGAYIGRGLQILAESFDQSQFQQDEIEAKRQGVLLDVRLDELKEEVKAEPDFSKRDQLYQEKAAEYLTTTTSQIGSKRVQQSLGQYFSLKFPREALKVRVENQKEWGENRVAQTDALGDIIADRIIATGDPQEAAKYRQLYKTQLDSLSDGPFAPRRADQTQNMMQAWEKKVTLKRADAQIRTNPTAFLADQAAGKYAEFDLDTSLRLGEKARKQIDDQEKATERATKKIRDKVDDEWSALANFGKLSPDELDKALKNEHPYISPDRARTLKAINDNPPTTEGNESVGAIASEYYLSPRTLPHIAATRAKLRALQNQLGKPNPAISKLANELQADQTTMENQAISRDANAIAAQNREIANIITGYEADKVDVPPFVERLLGNRSAQDKAKIRNEYLKTKDPQATKKLADRLAKGVKTKVEAIPQRMKDVMGYGE